MLIHLVLDNPVCAVGISLSIVEKVCKEIQKQIPEEFHGGGNALYFVLDSKFAIILSIL